MYGAHGDAERANLKDMAGAVETLLNLIGGAGSSRAGKSSSRCGR
jgi:hypothetical protein